MEISSRFSLYDVLAIIIPGVIIMASINVGDFITEEHTQIIFCCGCELLIPENLDFVQSAALLSAAYIIGLINNWINDGVFRGFRNNRNAIENQLLKVLHKNGNKNLKNYIGNSYEHVKIPTHCLPITCIKMIPSIILGWVPCKNKNTRNFTTYYKAYYALASHNKLGSVPLIESQVALLRNLFIPLAVMSISHKSELTCNEIWLLAIFAICLFVVMIQRQDKVYQLIWESANFYNL